MLRILRKKRGGGGGAKKVTLFFSSKMKNKKIKNEKLKFLFPYFWYKGSEKFTAPSSFIPNS